jgi:hypothetical protein
VVPLDLSVERVLAAGGKLWVTLDAQVGKVIGAEEGLGIAVKKKPRKPVAPSAAKPARETRPPGPPAASRPASVDTAGGGK